MPKPTPQPNTFGRRLRELRRDRSLTQERLGKAVGCSRNNVSLWESGRHNPEWSRVLLICAALHCTPNDFL